MKFFIIAFLFLFTSCIATKKVSLKGQYLSTPYEVISENSKDVVWDKLIDVFAQKGLAIKVIDKSSGLIVSEESALQWSFEDAKGRLINKKAWVVLPQTIDKATYKPFKPYQVLGGWNVRIKETPEKKAIINVNLVNIKEVYSSSSPLSGTVASTGAVSTGKFEEIIADLIK